MFTFALNVCLQEYLWDHEDTQLNYMKKKKKERHKGRRGRHEKKEGEGWSPSNFTASENVHGTIP